MMKSIWGNRKFVMNMSVGIFAVLYNKIELSGMLICDISPHTVSRGSFANINSVNYGFMFSAAYKIFERKKKDK